MNKFQNKILIVGAGFSGAVIAHELAKEGFNIDVIDKRDHIAGNAYDYLDAETNIRKHKYGPHIFHTNNQKVYEWIIQFGEWIEYFHKVKGLLTDKTLCVLPPNQETIKIIPRNKIIDTFYRPYSKKMWNLEIEEIDPSILNRVKVRDDNNDLYFPNDKYQIMPKHGYTEIISNILKHPQINIFLSHEFNKDMESKYDYIFNSMSIDEYFNYDLGYLDYRSIKFKDRIIKKNNLTKNPVINFTTQSNVYTRFTEWKNFPFHGSDSKDKTLITFEQPCDFRSNNFERYYPVKDLENKNRDLYKSYNERVNSEKMKFIGRCGLYVYIDMHQAISSSLAIASNFIKNYK